MNLLAVDIGNTDIKFGLFRDGELSEQWRASGTRTQPERFSAILRDSLAHANADFDALVYTSVVPDIEAVFRKTIQYCFHLPAQRIFSVNARELKLPLDFSRYPLAQLGMDRLVNACSAYLLYPGAPLVIVDFGTATTFDLVSAEGHYWGGAIAPGLWTFSECLSQHTARLPKVSLLEKRYEDLHMGTNTVACLEAGLGLGYRGMIRELLAAAVRDLPQADDDAFPRVIATGGLAQSIMNLCGLADCFEQADPALTLRGLSLIYEYNRKQTPQYNRL